MSLENGELTVPVATVDPGAKPQRKRSIPYRPSIDGLRAVAVLAVLAFHLKHSFLPGGFVGVDIFFVISGYLITSILREENDHAGFSPLKFYQRRIARLMPAYFVVAAATFIGAWCIYSPQDLASAAANLVASTLSVANLKFLTQGNYFVLSPDAQPFLHCWSLSVEEQFYMFFPITYFLIFRKLNRHRTACLLTLGLLSFAACILVTRRNPTYSFFLLPTRAWELLAGAILADLNIGGRPADAKRGPWICLAGLVLIAVSICFIHEGDSFPGYIAALPVLGSVGVLWASGTGRGLGNKILSWSPMVWVGRLSYSLYLWHWPVFSLVDYRCYYWSTPARVAIKLAITFAATAIGYYLIESPGRMFLNAPKRRWLAFAFLALCFLVFVPLGIATRKSSYINAERSDVAKGGLRFNMNATKGTLVLMGDSNGSMYGTTARDIAQQLGMKLVVLSVAGDEALPRTTGQNSALWTQSLAVVNQLHPDTILLACNWRTTILEDPDRLKLALHELEPLTKHIVLVTQPPELPSVASREAIRDGARPPFFEDPALHTGRLQANAIVKSAAEGKVSVIDIEPYFTIYSGEILLSDSAGHQFFHDHNHLSGYGADRVKPDLVKAIQNQ